MSIDNELMNAISFGSSITEKRRLFTSGHDEGLQGQRPSTPGQAITACTDQLCIVLEILGTLTGHPSWDAGGYVSFEGEGGLAPYKATISEDLKCPNLRQ